MFLGAPPPSTFGEIFRAVSELSSVERKLQGINPIAYISEQVQKYMSELKVNTD